MCFSSSSRSDISRRNEATRSVAVSRSKIMDRPCAATGLSSVMSRSSQATARFSSVSRSVAARGFRIALTSATSSAEKLRFAALSKPNPSPRKKNSAICRRPSVRSLLMRAVPGMTLYQKPPLFPLAVDPDCARKPQPGLNRLERDQRVELTRACDIRDA